MSHRTCTSNSEYDQHLLDRAIKELWLDRPDLTSSEQDAIRLILQNNLESGRISRRFNGHPPDQIVGFLAAYVATVAYYYPKENPFLISLHAGCPDTWSKLTDWLIRCAHVKLQRLNDRLSDFCANDFAQETDVWLLEEISKVKQSGHIDRHSPSVGQAIGYRYDVPFKDWIAKVQSNHIIDMIRWLCRHPNSYIGEEVDVVPDEDHIEAALDRMTLVQEISKLTPRQQEVITRLYDGMNIDDISRQLDCTGRAVYNRKYAALNHLRRQLKEESRF